MRRQREGYWDILPRTILGSAAGVSGARRPPTGSSGMITPNPPPPFLEGVIYFFRLSLLKGNFFLLLLVKKRKKKITRKGIKSEGEEKWGSFQDKKKKKRKSFGPLLVNGLVVRFLPFTTLAASRYVLLPDKNESFSYYLYAVVTKSLFKTLWRLVTLHNLAEKTKWGPVSRSVTQRSAPSNFLFIPPQLQFMLM